jgi:prevent-host-death family protein
MLASFRTTWERENCLWCIMSEAVSAAEANRQFSKILRAVEAGDTITITSHGRPVARLCPANAPDPSRIAARRRLLAWLGDQPTQNLGKWSRDELYER